MTKLRSLLPLGFWLLSAFGLLSQSGCGGEVNLDAVPTAKAGCEAPTQDALHPGSTMLPGRNCIDCHRSGGQADEYPWSAAGTIYSTAAVGSACNANGAGGVLVELIDMNDTVLAKTTTNSAGNFYFTSSQFNNRTLVRARITKGTTTRTMPTPVSVAAGCALCHQPNGAAGDRIYLQ